MPASRPEHIPLFCPPVLRRSLLPVLLAAAILSVIVIALYHQDVRHQRVVLEQEARHVLALKNELLLFEFQAVQSDLLYLASQETLKRFIAQGSGSRNELEREYASFALNKAVYDQIRLLDTDGQESVRVNYRNGEVEIVPTDELQNKAARYYYKEALSLDKFDVFVSPFDLNVEHGQIEQPIKPVIRFLTPIFDTSGAKKGLLALNYLGAPLLSKLRQVAVGFRGKTMLVNPSGEFLHAPDSSYEWGWLLGHKRNFRNEFPRAWTLVSVGAKGFLPVGTELFAIERVYPARRIGDRHPERSNVLANQDQGPLILVAYVSAAVASAHSMELLGQLMMMYAGVMAIVAILSIYWARSSEIRRYHEQHIEESESRLRQLSSLLLGAQETERRRLSRDLHDELGQQVTAIKLDLRSLEKMNGGSHSSPLLSRAIKETDQLLQSLHEIATRVRPSLLDDLSFQDAIESFLADYEKRTGISVISRINCARRAIPAKIGENAYRVLQEALANVSKHARVDRVDVLIDTNDTRLLIMIRDTGAGFDPEQTEKSNRLGILGMRERVELLDGRFDLKSKPGGGTEIGISIPINENA